MGGFYGFSHANFAWRWMVSVISESYPAGKTWSHWCQNDARRHVKITCLFESWMLEHGIFLQLTNQQLCFISVMCISVITCPPLDDPVGGNVKMDGYRVGNMATYTCVLGYKLDGPATRICTDTGTWSDYAPKCDGELSFPMFYSTGIYLMFKQNYWCTNWMVYLVYIELLAC